MDWLAWITKNQSILYYALTPTTVVTIWFIIKRIAKGERVSERDVNNEDLHNALNDLESARTDSDETNEVLDEAWGIVNDEFDKRMLLIPIIIIGVGLYAIFGG